MVPRPSLIVALMGLSLLAACGDRQPLAPRDAHGQADGGYVQPPQLTEATVANGQMLLRGRAQAGAQLALTTPAGQAQPAKADSKGGFTFALPVATAAQVFGLSMQHGGRRVQAEGYVLVTPKGQAVLLRAGAAAERLDMPGRYGVGAFDFDGSGSGTVTGRAPANTGLSVRLDGRQAVEARSGEDGVYIIALPTLRPGPHRIEVVGDDFTQAIDVTVTPAAPPTDGPIRATPASGGLRIDWVTPGGGLQSTIVTN